MERQDYETYHNQLLPYLQRHTNLQQVTNAMKRRPGGNDVGWVDFELPQTSIRDHRDLLEDETFLSLVTTTYGNGIDGIQYLGNFLEDAGELKSSVEQSLE